MYDNEDWLGCKRCGQFFHTSCLGVNFAMTLQDPFFSFFKVCDGVVAQLVEIYI